MFLTLAEELDKMPKTRNNYIGCNTSFCLIFIKKNNRRLRFQNVTAYIIAALKSLDYGKYIEEIN